MNGDIYQSPTDGKVSFGQMATTIVDTIRDFPKDRFSIVVGSDSEAGETVEFVTAVVLHRIGRGARYFYARHTEKKYPALRPRIWQEVVFSLRTAQKLRDMLGLEATKNVEVHIDVGVNGPTKVLINEVVGMVRGSGFIARIKPEAYAAAAVADRLV